MNGGKGKEEKNGEKVRRHGGGKGRERTGEETRELTNKNNDEYK